MSVVGGILPPAGHCLLYKKTDPASFACADSTRLCIDPCVICHISLHRPQQPTLFFPSMAFMRREGLLGSESRNKAYMGDFL